MDYFYSEKNGKKDNIWEYVSEKMTADSTLELFLAIDSKRRKTKTSYVVSVVLYSPTRKKGAEVWFKRYVEKTSPDLFTRLWKEVELTNEWGGVAWENLKHILKTKDKLNVHMDLNPNPKTRSYKVFKAGYPWIASLGYNVAVKPDSWACRAADHLA
jgi:predicted RNase H-related nuclease YkuK (DUF458 family)